MSIKVMTLVWDLQLPQPEKILLLALADNAYDEGFCWPSVATHARKASMADRRVRRDMKRLAQAGHLTVIPQTQASNTYRVHPGGP